MAQFQIKLPDDVLDPYDIASVREFSERTDWRGLPSSARTHASAIKVVLWPTDTDTTLAEKTLLLIASYRMTLYVGSPAGSSIVDRTLWLSLAGKIDALAATMTSESQDASQLRLDRLKLAVELLKTASELHKSESDAAGIIRASGLEVSQSCDIQLIDSADERAASALAIAALAKQYAFDTGSEDRAVNTAIFILVLVSFAAIIGSAVGLVWGLALSGGISGATMIGAVAGGTVGVLLGILSRTAKLGGNLTDKECMFVAGNMAIVLGMLAGAAGVVAWVVRAVFF